MNFANALAPTHTDFMQDAVAMPAPRQITTRMSDEASTILNALMTEIANDASLTMTQLVGIRVVLRGHLST
jgi:hypothetical protein